jgi:hypothetical protein
MWRKNKVAWIFWFIFLWPTVSWAQETEKYNMLLEGRYWYPKLNSTVKIVENQIGTDINLVDDLGFDKEKGFGEGRLQIKVSPYHKFNFSYLPMKWEGDKAISRNIQFSGQTYPAGTRVQSEETLKLFKGGYEYEFFGGWLGFFAATIDLLVADASLQLKAPGPGLDQKEHRTLAIPMIGLNSRQHIGKYVDLTAKISGLPAGQYGYIYDLDGSLDINPNKYVGISVGYRFWGVKTNYQDNSVTIKLNGPFASLTVRF